MPRRSSHPASGRQPLEHRQRKKQTPATKWTAVDFLVKVAQLTYFPIKCTTFMHKRFHLKCLLKTLCIESPAACLEISFVLSSLSMKTYETHMEHALTTQTHT